MNSITLLKVFLFATAIFISPFSFSQIPNNSFEISAGTGKVVRNYPDFPDLNVPAFNACINYSKHFNGYKPWHEQ